MHSIDLTNIHSFSDFQRNAKAHLRRLKETGKPQVLTVNGHAEIVVQDAAAYQKLIDAAEETWHLQRIRESIAQADRGESRPFREVFAELAARAGIALPE